MKSYDAFLAWLSHRGQLSRQTVIKAAKQLEPKAYQFIIHSLIRLGHAEPLESGSLRVSPKLLLTGPEGCALLCGARTPSLRAELAAIGFDLQISDQDLGPEVWSVSWERPDCLERAKECGYRVHHQNSLAWLQRLPTIQAALQKHRLTVEQRHNSWECWNPRQKGWIASPLHDDGLYRPLPKAGLTCWLRRSGAWRRFEGAEERKLAHWDEIRRLGLGRVRYHADGMTLDVSRQYSLPIMLERPLIATSGFLPETNAGVRQYWDIPKPFAVEVSRILGIVLEEA